MPGYYSSFFSFVRGRTTGCNGSMFTLGKNLDNSSLACSFVAVVPMAQFAVLQMSVSICLFQLKFPASNFSALKWHRPA